MQHAQPGGCRDAVVDDRSRRLGVRRRRPAGAGKSTVANALLEFLPRTHTLYVTAGGWDGWRCQPRPVCYLLVNELSGHMPVYLYGRAAQRAFALLENGTRMLGTLHARSASEAVRVMCYEAEIARARSAYPLCSLSSPRAGSVGRLCDALSSWDFWHRMAS